MCYSLHWEYKHHKRNKTHSGYHLAIFKYPLSNVCANFVVVHNWTYLTISDSSSSATSCVCAAASSSSVVLLAVAPAEVDATAGWCCGWCSGCDAAVHDAVGHAGGVRVAHAMNVGGGGVDAGGGGGGDCSWSVVVVALQEEHEHLQLCWM
jgi:hypothetical protein